MKSNTGIIASAKIKIPKREKIEDLEGELKKINREIYCNFCDKIIDDSLYDRKRLIIAQIGQ